jgi:hypothetical protein
MRRTHAVTAAFFALRLMDVLRAAAFHSLLNDPAMILRAEIDPQPTELPMLRLAVPPDSSEQESKLRTAE